MIEMRDLAQEKIDQMVKQAVMNVFEGALGGMGAGDLVQKAQTTGAPIGPYMHGPGGLFGVRGLDQPIISTHTQIIESLAASLPVRSGSQRTLESGEINPLVPYVTGFLAADPDEPNNVCDDPPAAGNMKTCIGTAQYGRKSFATRQIEVNRVGQTINRGEFLDGRLVNSPLVNQLGGIMAQRFALGRQEGIFAGREMVMRIVEVGVAMQRWLCPQTFTGNPGNNSAGGGYAEFPGLDLLIGTNKVDAIAGTSCPSLNSTILDFGFSDVQDINAQWSIVRVMTHLYRYLKKKAIQQNFGVVQHALVMRSGLFDAIADVWPCDYMTNRCQFPNTNAGGNAVINDTRNIDMRDAMRNGKYLLVDGMQIPVICDDCITEETTADNANVPDGAVSSDIYVVPLSAMNGTFNPMFWEFYDYSQGAMVAIRDANATPFFWSDAGRFLWSVKSPDNWCLELIMKMEPRLRLLTPQLAARITNVVYTPQFGLHYDDPLPNQPYHVNGGISTGYPPSSPYSEWNPGGPGINP